MKPRVWLLALLMVLLVTGYGLLRPDQSSRLRKTWRQLLEQARKEPGASLLSAAQTARSIQGFFSSNAVIELGAPYPTTIRRAQWPGLIGQAWQVAEQIRVRELGHELTLEEGGRAARMETTLELQATVAGETSRHVDSYRLEWRTEDGSWLIQQVTHLDTIRNPAVAPIQ